MQTIIDKFRPEKSLLEILPKNSGRDMFGHVAVRGVGGRRKRYYRIIDWKRNKPDISAVVAGIEYDPNRTANIALLYYEDGEKRYIIAPDGLKTGMKVMAGKQAEPVVGNCLPLEKIPVGMPIHNIEPAPGRGGIWVRAAGTSALIISHDKDFASVKMPSGEVRLIPEKSYAVVGQIGNIGWKEEVIGKVGRSRLRGRRPKVRGVAQNPRSHPHGGGEGRSGIGMASPKSPWGKPTQGNKTRRPKKYSDKYIVKKRK